MLIVQDYNQLKKYNTNGNSLDSIIKSSCQLVYFLASGDEKTLRDVSTSLGTKTVKTKSYSSSSSGTSSTSESERDKPVMSVAELKEKNPNHLLITKPGNKPILIESLFAFKYFENDGYIYSSPDNLQSVNITSELFDPNSSFEVLWGKDSKTRNYKKEQKQKNEKLSAREKINERKQKNKY